VTVNEPSNTVSQPSFTALTAAAARAAHLIVDESPVIFADTRAAALLGDRADELIGYHRQQAAHPILATARSQVVCRSRFAEDRLAAAVAAGVRQYVVLGAGLDTFAYRSPLAAHVRVFEVDHPSTQDWKRSALAGAHLGVRPDVVFVPADLAADSLAGALRAAGFDVSEPAVISWLGVTMYLDRAAIGETLTALAGCAPGTELIADYMLPQALRDETGNLYTEMIMAAAAERGEPWLSFFTPVEMTSLLAEHGFHAAAQVRQHESVPPELWQRADSLRPVELSMIARARLAGP
jgi:methyltransferase (TIGR00027 family)